MVCGFLINRAAESWLGGLYGDPPLAGSRLLGSPPHDFWLSLNSKAASHKGGVQPWKVAISPRESLP